MASTQDGTESTISSLISAGPLLLLKCGLAETVRATHSVAERTSGRTAALFWRLVICAAPPGTSGGSSLSIDALMTSASPNTNAGVMDPSRGRHRSLRVFSIRIDQ